MRGKKAKEIRKFLESSMGLDPLKAKSKTFYRGIKKQYVKGGKVA